MMIGWRGKYDRNDKLSQVLARETSDRACCLKIYLLIFRQHLVLDDTPPFQGGFRGIKAIA